MSKSTTQATQATQAERESFRWQTREGEILTLAEMRTSHLFWCVRMFWNHYAPVEIRLRPYRQYNPIWPKEMVLRSLRLMLDELAERDDIEERFLDDLEFMQHHAATWKKNIANTSFLQDLASASAQTTAKNTGRPT